VLTTLQADELVEKVYANMSACHIKRENWKRAQETAEKALAKNPANYKAMFRRAKALGEQGFFERAEKILEELIKQSPAGMRCVVR
jgi:tetratricopeptide (TPR) repeat protein